MQRRTLFFEMLPICLPGVLKKGSLKGALKLFLLENFLN